MTLNFYQVYILHNFMSVAAVVLTAAVLGKRP